MHVWLVQAHMYNAFKRQPDTKTPHIKATCGAQHTKRKRQPRKTRNIKAFYFFLCLDTLNFKCIYLFVRRPYNDRYPDNIFWNGDKKMTRTLKHSWSCLLQNTLSQSRKQERNSWQLQEYHIVHLQPSVFIDKNNHHLEMTNKMHFIVYDIF